MYLLQGRSGYRAQRTHAPLPSPPKRDDLHDSVYVHVHVAVGMKLFCWVQATFVLSKYKRREPYAGLWATVEGVGWVGGGGVLHGGNLLGILQLVATRKTTIT